MTVAVRVRTSVLYRGEPQEAGAVLKVDAFDAYLLTSSSRAELVDQADAKKVREAVEAANAKALRPTGSSRPPGWR